jgi:hypothetical protein
MLGFIFPDRLGAFEPFRQQMHQRRIDIVDAVSQPQKFWIGRGHIIPLFALAASAARRLVLSEGVAPAKFPRRAGKIASDG